jgi:dynein heavy chain
MILKLLYESKGDLLSDEALIDALKVSKLESARAEEKLGRLEQDQETFNQVRMNYKDVGKRVANLFFVVLDLA